MTQSEPQSVPDLSLGIERVLLAGHSSIEAETVTRYLRASGILVRQACLARDVLAMARGFCPDFVVLCWHGLDVPGEDFMRMLQHSMFSRPPFIVAMGAPFDAAGLRNDALRAGVDVVLPGRLDDDDLSAVLAVAARQKARFRAEEKRFRRVLGKLSDLQQRFESLDGDLLEAKKLQQSLLRERHVESGATDISLILRSSGHVGGDLVGHFPISHGLHGFFALDVSGHGVSSALMTARLAGYLSATNPRQNIAIEIIDGESQPRCPSAAVEDLNMLVMEDLDTDHYFTMILGYIDGYTGHVTFCQAGHPHPIIQKVGGATEFLAVGGLPVGLIPGADYTDTELKLAKGDRLLILSDGFSEANLPDGSFLGEGGLVRLLDASRDQRGPALLETLVWDLNEAIGEAEFRDDLSGVLLEFTPRPKT